MTVDVEHPGLDADSPFVHSREVQCFAHRSASSGCARMFSTQGLEFKRLIKAHLIVFRVKVAINSDLAVSIADVADLIAVLLLDSA